MGVFGQERKKKNFVQQILKSIFSGKDVFAPEDQYMNPILSNDLASVTTRLVKDDISGVVNVAGDTCISKYDFAKKIATYFDYSDKVIPLTSNEMKQRAPRPKMGCLDCSELFSMDIDIPSLDAGLQKFLGSEFL